MKDYLIRGIDETGQIRVFVARTTDLVEEARKSHDSSPVATAALGRSLTAAAIMGAMMKNEEDKLSLKINGSGPLGSIVVTANSRGEVKGYVDNPAVVVADRPDNKLNVGEAVGREGYVTVTKDLGLKDPYLGQAKLYTGEIAEDIAAYFALSEQQPSAVGLGVLVDKDISVKSAGGFIIQLLPGVAEEDIDRIEKSLEKIEPVSSYIDRGLSPEEIMEEILKDFNMRVLDKMDLKFLCDCSRERMEGALKSIGAEEIQAMIDEDDGAELVCHFCNKKENFTREDLEKLILDKDK